MSILPVFLARFQTEQVVNVADLDYMNDSGVNGHEIDFVASAKDLKTGEIAVPPQAMARTSAPLTTGYQTPATAGGMHTAALGAHNNDFPFPACKRLHPNITTNSIADPTCLFASP